MITAQKLLRNQEVSVSIPDKLENDGKRWIIDVNEVAVVAIMIEFAKQHVKAALKELVKQEYDRVTSEKDINELLLNTIKHTYPLENIK